MRERIWFWVLWASAQLGSQAGRVKALARASRSFSLLDVLTRRAQPPGPRRSVFVVPQGRPHERNGLGPRRSSTRHTPSSHV